MDALHSSKSISRKFRLTVRTWNWQVNSTEYAAGLDLGELSGSVHNIMQAFSPLSVATILHSGPQIHSLTLLIGSTNLIGHDHFRNDYNEFEALPQDDLELSTSESSVSFEKVIECEEVWVAVAGRTKGSVLRKRSKL